MIVIITETISEISAEAGNRELPIPATLSCETLGKFQSRKQLGRLAKNPRRVERLTTLGSKVIQVIIALVRQCPYFSLT